jgi:hypothetical protein
MAALAILSAPVAAQAANPDIKVTKGCSLDPAHGPTAVYCVINVINVGNANSISPITLTDSPTGPAGTIFTSASGSFGCSTPTGALPATIHCGAPYSLTTGNNPGASGSDFLYFKLPPSGGTFSNCATATQGPGNPADPNSANNTHICATVVVPGAGAPDIKVSKSCALDPAHGPTAVYCVINVVNIGNANSISPITLTDSPAGPAGTIFTSASGSFGCSTPTGALPATIHCGAPYSLTTGNNPGASGSDFLYFKLPPSGGTLSNCATATQGAGNPADPNAANNTHICTTVTVPPQLHPDLSVTKTCAINGPQSVLCTVTVTNIGTAASVNPMHLADVVSGAPSNGQYVGAGGTLPISCSPGAGPILPISCNANTSLTPGQSKNALFAFHLPTGGTFTNCATVTEGSNPGTSPDPNPGNNTNICTTITVPNPLHPDLSVTKTCAVTAPQYVHCIITVTNNGTAASVSPMHLADLVTSAPSNGQFVGGGGTLPISCSPGAGPILPISCNANASLAPGQSKNALFDFRLPTGGTFTNCATVTEGSNPGTAPDPNPGNNTNICTTITVPGPLTSCTAYPMTADVYFYNPMTPFGPQTVNICHGGHVLFHNVSTGIPLIITDVGAPGGASLFPPVSLSGNGVNAPTAALATGSPNTYEYKITGFVLHGHINVF